MTMVHRIRTAAVALLIAGGVALAQEAVGAGWESRRFSAHASGTLADGSPDPSNFALVVVLSGQAWTLIAWRVRVDGGLIARGLINLKEDVLGNNLMTVPRSGANYEASVSTPDGDFFVSCAVSALTQVIEYGVRRTTEFVDPEGVPDLYAFHHEQLDSKAGLDTCVVTFATGETSHSFDYNLDFGVLQNRRRFPPQ